MARRLVSRTLLLLPIKSHLISSSSSSSGWRAGKVVHRLMSNKASSSAGKIIEIDLGSSSFEGGDTEAMMMKKMEDLIQRIIVQRSTPDWLPFMPGSSFWVPPGNYSRPGNLDDLFSKLRGGGFDTCNNNNNNNTIGEQQQQYPLTDEQEIAFFTLRGWPSSHFQDHHHTEFRQEVTLEVKVFETSGNTDDQDE